MLIIAAARVAERDTYTCGVCGFVMNEAGACPRCKLVVQAQARDMEDTGEERSVLDQVRDWLAGLDG